MRSFMASSVLLVMAGHGALLDLRAEDARFAGHFRGRVTGVDAPDPKQVAQWIADLDDNGFATREEAQKQLKRLGWLAGPALRKALDNPSPEVRRRLERLLERMGPVTADKPMSAAQVFIVPFYRESKAVGPGRAKTDADGRFEFDAADMTYTEFDGLAARREGLLIVTKNGYGPDWFLTRGHKTGAGGHAHWNPVKGAALNLQLVTDDVPIHGRFLDPAGRPLAGARVRLKELMIPWERDLSAHLDREKRNGNECTEYERHLDQPHLIPWLTTETRTDADGRFTLSGIGRDRLAVLKASAPSVVDTTLTVMTRDAPDVGTVYGAGFTLQLKPGLTIKGLVRDRDTKAPISGMWVGRGNPLTYPSLGPDTAVTDEKGRFTITGLDPVLLNLEKELRGVTAIPQPGGRYLMTKGFFERDGDVVIECARGVPFRLKLVDEQGKPVEGNVEYWPISPNPQVEELIRPFLQWSYWQIMNRAARRADGAYEGFVLPGPGAVVVKTSGESYRPAHVDPKDFFEPGRTNWTEQEKISTYGTHTTLMTHNGLLNQHDYAAIVLVKPAKDSGPLELSATVVRDRPRQVTLIDPDGKPVVGAVAHLYNRNFSTTLFHVSSAWPFKTEAHLRAASFPLTGLQPDRVQRIDFAHVDRQLIGFLKASADGETPYTVRMQPWGMVTGRFVDANGKPLKSSLEQLVEDRKVPPEQAKVLRRDYRDELVVRNDNPEGSAFCLGKIESEGGRFRIDGLVPGQSYSCVSIYRRFTHESLPAPAFEKLVLRPGEVRDLGDVRVDRP